MNPASLVDVVLDFDRPPVVYERGREGRIRRKILKTCPRLTQEELEAIGRHELLAARWTRDNRTGVTGTLHRVSRLCDRGGAAPGPLAGLTLRMAHPMYGMTGQVRPLQRVSAAGRSLLVLGPPGSGKTTLLREIARIHDEEFERRVFVVDTSSEICGFFGRRKSEVEGVEGGERRAVGILGSG